MNLRKIN